MATLSRYRTIQKIEIVFNACACIVVLIIAWRLWAWGRLAAAPFFSLIQRIGADDFHISSALTEDAWSWAWWHDALWPVLGFAALGTAVVLLTAAIRGMWWTAKSIF
jgi:hypothetical protein